MQNKTKFATIAILSSALFAAALAMSLTVQPAAAICTKKGTCAQSDGTSTGTGRIIVGPGGGASLFGSASNGVNTIACSTSACVFSPPDP